MSESETEEPVVGNEGWADVLGKVLRSKAPKKKTLVLAKARKDGQTKKAPEPSIEIVDVEGDVKVEEEQKAKEVEPEYLTKKQLKERKDRKRKWEALCRAKPGAAEQHEQHLRRIATKGVVQLFTAVEKHQKDVQRKLSAAGESETKRDKVMKSLNRGAFLDLLKPKEVQKKEEPKAWSVLRDDFMLGANMKDWDKQDDEPT
ncbi:RRP15-like protein [Ornithodoros turicata]|uniref:RRP15-like protein n=1 Tax=Ornithodoros turicata TaxID=34597 RepID=UPI0031392459